MLIIGYYIVVVNITNFYMACIGVYSWIGFVGRLIDILIDFRVVIGVAVDVGVQLTCIYVVLVCKTCGVSDLAVTMAVNSVIIVIVSTGDVVSVSDVCSTVVACFVVVITAITRICVIFLIKNINTVVFKLIMGTWITAAIICICICASVGICVIRLNITDSLLQNKLLTDSRQILLKFSLTIIQQLRSLILFVLFLENSVLFY